MSDSAANTPALVVLVNNRRDWRRIVEEHWYRIPLRHVPHPVAAAYLAFYQSRVFGPDAYRIRFVAPVRRYQIMERRELLPDEPGHPRAGDRYYRIELGPLEELAYPIPSRRLRRVTFIPTTLQRLREADEINGLWLGDDMEEILWELFRDAGIKAERRLEIGEGRQRYTAPFAIPSHSGEPARRGIAIFYDQRARPAYLAGWRLLTLAPGRVRSAPQACLRLILDSLNGRP